MGRPPAPIGARRLDPGGYVRIRVDHPLAVDGWVREHRAVLFAAIGDGEHPCYRCGTVVAWGTTLEVDHLDRDRRNNSVQNLAPACRGCQNRNRGRWGLRKKGGAP
jgi:5-methylcytosine-specific restriction endonuclease McrA